MNKIFLLFVIIILNFSSGCASLWGIKSGAEALDYKIEKTGPTEVKKELLQAVSVNSGKTFDSLQIGTYYIDSSKKQNNYNDISFDQFATQVEVSPSQIDSLKEKLYNDGSIKINPEQGFLIDYLRPKENIDTIFLANLFFPTEKRGIPVTFQYQVKKDDQIFFEFENQKARKIKKIEIIEGDESRFNHTNLKKKNKIEGNLKIQSDNTMTINVVKSGFFKSFVKMKIRKLSKPSSLAVEMVTDTLVETKKVVVEVVDTLFSKIEEKKYSLSPRLDITNLNKIDFPIDISNTDNLIGWGYWLGIGNEALNKYNDLAKLSPEIEPLISFIKSELKIIENHTHLPRSKNPDVSLKINKLVTDFPSLNSSENYGYYTSIDDSSPKAKISLFNNSKLYSQDISLLVVAVNTENSLKEIDKEFYKEIPRLKLTLLP